MSTPKVVKPVVGAEVRAAEEESFLTKLAREIKAGLAASGGQLVTEATIGHVKKVFDHSRERLFNDLNGMKPEDTKNLWTRLGEAGKKFAEPRLVRLLCYATDKKDATEEDRRAVLCMLNHLTDEPFKQRMSLLEHNIIQQGAQWVMMSAEDAIGYLYNQAKSKIPPLAEGVAHHITTGINDLNNAAERSLPEMRRRSDELQAKYGSSPLGALLRTIQQQRQAKRGGRP